MAGTYYDNHHLNVKDCVKISLLLEMPIISSEHVCLSVCLEALMDTRTRSAWKSPPGKQLRSGMSYRKWSGIRLPVPLIAPLGGGGAMIQCQVMTTMV